MNRMLGAMPRLVRPEIMDSPALDTDEHHRALAGLARINACSRAATHLWRPVAELASRYQRPLRVLDVACGGGDVLCALACRARRAALPLQFAGCDISPRAIEYAARQARRSDVFVELSVVDALRDPLPINFDVIMSSLFLHHLAEADATDLLRKMSATCARMIVVSDLRRSHRGLWLAHVATRFLTMSTVVHRDGPCSVLNAFTKDELSAMAQSAGLKGFEITSCWPQRMRLVWQRG